MVGLVTIAVDASVSSPHLPIIALYWRAPVAEGRPVPYLGSPGTGGTATLEHVLHGQGYRPFFIVQKVRATEIAKYPSFSELMGNIKVGFGRTMTHLPAVFGVSRQTLYNWIEGDEPREQHQQKIIQLANAATTFIDAGFKPTALYLDRVIAQGKTFLQLMSEGGDGADTANKLMRVVQRGMTARAKLDAMLGDRSPVAVEISDIGRQSFNENV